MCCSTRPLRECGQATVEAAFVIPLLFALFGVLLQPALLLYDRCVMGAAAAETCRLASTQPCSEDAMRAFALRRLAALPPLDLFHSQDCPWELDVQAGQGAQASQVRIIAPRLPGFSTLSTTAISGLLPSLRSSSLCSLLLRTAISPSVPSR